MHQRAMNQHERLRGSHVPLVTPFRDGGALDEETLGRLVEHHVAEGTTGVVIGGSTGDSQSLTTAERERALEAAVAAARGRIRVIAATGTETLEETVRLTDHADRVGADALLIITPRATPLADDGIVAYFTMLAGRTERPVLVYNYPARTQAGVSAAALERMIAQRSNIIGVKHTDDDLRRLRDAVTRLGPGFLAFGGFEPLVLAVMLAGGAGLITAAANLVPRRCRRLFDLATEHRLDEAWKEQDAITAVFDLIMLAPSPGVAVKYLLRRAGLIPSDEHRLPIVPPSDGERRALDEGFERLNLGRVGAAV